MQFPSTQLMSLLWPAEPATPCILPPAHPPPAHHLPESLHTSATHPNLQARASLLCAQPGTLASPQDAGELPPQHAGELPPQHAGELPPNTLVSRPRIMLVRREVCVAYISRTQYPCFLQSIRVLFFMANYL